MQPKTISTSITHGVTLNAGYNYIPLYVTGTINTAAGDGVQGDNTQFWTVDNTGTIEATAGNGIKLLGGGAVTNGASGATSGLISGYNDGIDIQGTLGTVTNFGTIVAGANAVGVFLEAGGIVTNGTPGATTARIASGYTGVDIANVPGTVVNFATILGTASDGAVRLDGGVLVNGGSASTAATIDGDAGVAVYNAGGSLTLTNFGLITVTGSNGRPAVRLDTVGTTANSISNFRTISGNLATGIYQEEGGVITNGSSGAGTALIVGGPFGIDITGGAATVTNFGTIAGTGSAGTGVFLAAGGTVTNSGLIAGAVDGVSIANTSGAVINLGTIAGTSTSAPQVTGVALYGGSITNGAGTATAAVIYGVQYGAEIGGAAGTVVNFGSVVAGATGGTGLRLVQGGSIDNLGTITGPSTGIRLDSPTTVTNGQSGTAKGYIEGQTGVNMPTPGTLFNYGRIVGAGPSSTTGVYLTRGGTVHNFGTITAGGTAGNGVDFAFLNAGAIVVNGKSGSAAGLITGVSVGVSIETSGGTVTNFATITGGTDGVDLSGTVAVVLNNSGTINGGNHGAYLGGTAGATVVNSGTIDGGAEGVHTRDAPARVTNSGTSTIVGGTGILLGAGGTVTDSGTINGTSGIAISFGGAGANRLILDPGYHLGGDVVGSTSTGATNTLELGSAAGIGTVSTVLATEFVNFGTVTVDAGARWTLAGSSSLTGITLTDHGTLTNTGTLSGAAGKLTVRSATLLNKGSIGLTVTLSGGGYLANKATGTIATAGIAVAGTLGAATVVNLGTVQGSSGPGVYLAAGGSITNGSGGVTTPLIAGYDGIIVRSAPGTVKNYATITGSGIFDTGVSLDGGGSLYNRGAITASGSQSYAVFLVGGSLTNTIGGVITGGGKDGVLLRGVGSITNFGTIAAANTAVGIGVSFSGGGDTLVNAGTIGGASGMAVSFAGGGNRLVVEPGAVFTGIVIGGTAGDTLELGSAASIGTLSRLGTKYLGFSNVTVDTGARWVLSGGNTIGAGATLSTVGTLTDRGTLVDAGMVIGNGRLIVVSGGSEVVVAGGTTLGTGLSGGSEIVSSGGT
ncbi:MAG: hypothetical protein WA459_23690, partial [Stellaceae bacterium]